MFAPPRLSAVQCVDPSACRFPLFFSIRTIDVFRKDPDFCGLTYTLTKP